MLITMLALLVIFQLSYYTTGLIYLSIGLSFVNITHRGIVSNKWQNDSVKTSKT